MIWNLISRKNEKNRDIEFYITKKLRNEVRFGDGDLWLTQKLLGELYDTTRNNITMHIQNIFADGELEEKSVSKKFLLTASDGN